MDSTARQWQIPVGATVVAADGAKVGKVVAAQPDYVVVEKGFFFPTDYYVPTSAVADFDGDTAYLGVTKDEALTQGWDRAPAASAPGAAEFADRTAAEGAGVRTGATRPEAGDAIRVPVHEEELTATTRPVERGAVRVEKDVVAEERTLEVPVTEERVRVTRRAVDREGAADAAAFQEGTIEVPVRGEEVDVRKRTRVAEEVEVGKEAVQSTQRVADTVRREQVTVDDATVATDAATTDGTRRGAPTDAGTTDFTERPFTEETTTGTNTRS
jgi:uncharacterized protein (TIGR02271 family)